MFEFRIDDVDRLINQLSTLPSNVQRRGLDGAARAAMRPVQNAIALSAQKFDDPLTATQIYKMVVTQKASRTAKRIGGTMMRVGVIGGAKQPSDDKRSKRYASAGAAFYWRFREFGTEKQQAQPFMLPAFTSRLNEIQDVFADRMRKILDREVERSRFVGPRRPRGSPR